MSTLWLALLPILASGCAGIPPVLPPEARSQVTRTDVRSHVPQAEVNVQYLRSSYGGGLGLIGVIVDASVNAAKSGSAETRAKRIREAVKDYDFRAHYWQAISNVVVATPWLMTGSFSGEPNNAVPVQAATVAQGAAFNIGTDFIITPDHRVFEILTGVSIFLPGNHKKAAAANTMAYHSARIGDEEGDKAATLWTADQGAAYRRTATEGIAESARLLRHVLDYMGGSTYAAARPAKVKADFVHGRGDFGIPVGRVSLKGKVLEETAERIIFQTERGSFFSLPRTEAEITYLPAK